jgi:nicotinamidase-related amidase
VQIIHIPMSSGLLEHRVHFSQSSPSESQPSASGHCTHGISTLREGKAMNDHKMSQTSNGSAASRSNPIQDGIAHAPGGGDALLRLDDVVMLLLDHQSGLFQTVKDIPVAELRANTAMLAKLSTLLKIPVITTASVPDGPNGPLMPEIHELAPRAVYVPRKGEVNAWDNELFVKTVRETGRKTLIIAGVWTSVCVMFPALDATAAGFKVYAVIDASGDPSEMASRTTLARFVQAGIVPISANAVLCELQRTWNRPDAAEIAKLYSMVAPNYAAVIESYNRAQDAALHPQRPVPELTHA